MFQGHFQFYVFWGKYFYITLEDRKNRIISLKELHYVKYHRKMRTLIEKGILSSARSELCETRPTSSTMAQPTQSGPRVVPWSSAADEGLGEANEERGMSRWAHNKQTKKKDHDNNK